ncbi:hypothetical protein PENTCL1PPCAC_25409, partial [Pristionchus entomophagus]
ICVIFSLQNFDSRLILVYLGPCTIVSAKLCHLFMAGFVNSIAQSVLLLIISFAYRLRTLETAKSVMRRNAQIWTILQHIFALFNTVLQFIFFAGGSYDVPNFPRDRLFSSLDLTGEITENFVPRLSVIMLISMYYSCFFAVFSYRRRLFLAITNLKSSDRHSHQMIYRSLTAQLMLPLAYIIGSSMWLMDVVGVMHSPTLRRATLLVTSLYAFASPLVNMYYIPPYRK